MALKVLVLLEDNPDDVGLIKHVLHEHDANMIIEDFLSAESAIQYLKNGTLPDLMLVDLHLPGMDGIAFIHWVRQEGLTFPIVILSGYAQPKDISDTAKMEVSAYVAKEEFNLAKFKDILSIINLS